MDAPIELGAAPRILIAEPNRDYLGTIARRIAEAGYRVATADCAQGAMAELRRVPADLVIAELTMPGTSGVELVQMIRDDAVYRELPVVLIAGRSERDAAVRAFESGADGVVHKPFHIEVLIARIGRELQRARSVQRLRNDNETLDARVVTRAIELGEMRDRWLESENKRRKLEGEVRRGGPKAL
ncbi:MAG TPA: response regulator [Sphingomicrobium sp.]|nr:response regulator [Sphingomicrobium sp.]